MARLRGAIKISIGGSDSAQTADFVIAVLLSHCRVVFDRVRTVQ